MKSNYPKSNAKKPILDSGALGQVFTPPEIAKRMVKLLLDDLSNTSTLSILDPAVGPCTFPKSIVESRLVSSSTRITTVDIDKEMVKITEDWFKQQNSFDYSVIHSDYLELHMVNEYDYAIFNPPYIRQEWLETKQEYRSLFKRRYDVDIPGTSNLYVYFVVKVIMDLKPNGTFVCIIYDSWQSTIYGKWLNSFINQTCRDIQVEQISNQPFSNRLINATIVKGTKKASYEFISDNSNYFQQTKGIMAKFNGFSTIESIFQPRRGLRLKQTNFFLDNLNTVHLGATPFIKKVGTIKGFSVPNNHPEAAMLVWPENKDSRVINELEKRIDQAKLAPSENMSILSWYNEMPDSWYMHNKPPYAKIIFNYYLRNRPRHIYNPTRAYSDNFYGLDVPVNISVYACIAVLNSTAVCNEIIERSRSQGNGLKKIQLFEYREAFIPDIRRIDADRIRLLHGLGKCLVDYAEQSVATIERIDNLLWDLYGYSELEPKYINQCLSYNLANR